MTRRVFPGLSRGNTAREFGVCSGGGDQLAVCDRLMAALGTVGPA